MSGRPMTRVLIGALTCLLIGVSVSPVEAQEWLRGRFALHVNFGYQFSSDDFREDVEFRAYGETVRFVAAHEIKSGQVVDGGAFIQLWKQLAVGGTFSQTEGSDATSVTGTVPHPLQVGLDRSIAPQAFGLTRREKATHIHVAWLIPLPQVEKLDIRIMAGPSYFNLTQGSVPSVIVSEAGGPPFASVNVDDVVTGELVKNGWGGHISADISYMFSTYVGAGGFVRLAVGSVDLQRGGTSVTTSVGGFQSGGGLRVRF